MLAAGDAGLGVVIAPEAAESLGIDDELAPEEALASGAVVDGVVGVVVVVAGVVVVVVEVVSSFLLHADKAARLNDSAAIRVSDFMKAPGYGWLPCGLAALRPRK